MNNNEYRDQFKKRIYFYTLFALKELDKLPTKEIVTQIIVKQVVRSLTSIGANFIEAQASSSKRILPTLSAIVLNLQTRQNFGWVYYEIWVR